MIRGMTAYADKEKKIDCWMFSIQIWSYNHKFLQVGLFTPDKLRSYSQEIESIIRSNLKRGKVNLKIDFFNINEDKKKEIFYNQRLANEVYNIGRKEKKEGEMSLQMRDILLLPGMLEIKEPTPDFEKLWPKVKKLISTTLKELIEIKNKQGKNIATDLRKIISNIDNSLKKIKKIQKKERTEFSNQLKEKVEDVSSLKVEEDYLMDEVIDFIRSSDVSEEITRIKGYLDFLKKLLTVKEAVGRKIDFIAQELLRETNTIGAKKDTFEIKKEVVNMKEEVEKIREQAQNIE